MNIQGNDTVKNFFAETKKMFSTCKFAAANIENQVGDRNVWGDFTSKKQAAAAARMWLTAFRNFSPKLEARVEGKAYRIVVMF